MINLLVKTFIRDYEDISNPRVREAYGILGGVVGIILNVILCSSKIFIGTVFKSISITADGFNNLSDAGSSVISLIGFKLAGKPADKDHPFGHERIEYIAGLIVTFIILLLGFELVKTSIHKLINPVKPEFNILMIVVLIFSILVKLFMAYFNFNLSKRISSVAMKATAQDSLNDVITTSVVLATIVVAKFTKLNIDGFTGILVALFIIYSGVSILKDLLNPLIGEPPSKEMVDTIVKKIMSYEGVINMHDLVIHNYGQDKYFATVHVEVMADEDVIKSHDIIDNIERDFKRDLNINLVIHMDPIVKDTEQTREIKCEVLSIIKSIDKNFTIHDFRIVKGPSHTNLIFDLTVPVDYKHPAKELLHEIDKRIGELDKSYYPVVTLDYNYMCTK